MLIKKQDSDIMRIRDVGKGSAHYEPKIVCRYFWLQACFCFSGPCKTNFQINQHYIKKWVLFILNIKH